MAGGIKQSVAIIVSVNYTATRDALFTVASSEVIKNILLYENAALGCASNEIHNEYLTILINSIRKDLKVNNKKLPTLNFLK